MTSDRLHCGSFSLDSHSVEASGFFIPGLAADVAFCNFQRFGDQVHMSWIHLILKSAIGDSHDPVKDSYFVLTSAADPKSPVLVQVE